MFECADENWSIAKEEVKCQWNIYDRLEIPEALMKTSMSGGLLQDLKAGKGLVNYIQETQNAVM